MRLYIITANWGKGGPGGIAADIYKMADAQKWECRFAYGREAIPDEVNSYKIGTFITPYIHAAFSMVFDNAGFATKKSTYALIKDIQQFKPDVINLHNPLGYSMNVKLLFNFFRESGIPVFWTLHDCWSVTGHCITGICDHWKEGCGKCPQKKAYPPSYVLDRSRYNLIKKKECFSNIPNLKLISPSNWLKRLVSTTYLNQYSIEVIPNGIDLDVFKPTPSDLRKKYNLEGRNIILSVAGVWARTKGANYIYQLAEMLEDTFFFVLIGENRDKELKGNRRIMHIAHTNDKEQLAQWYTVADVFVNPTMGDNFPTVNLEALACGTPIVTFHTGGSGEAVGECGIVVDQGDILALKNGIYSCMRKRISSNCCVNQAKKYNKIDKFGEYFSLFNKIFNN